MILNDCIILPLNSPSIYLLFSHPFVLLMPLVLQHNRNNEHLLTMIGVFLPVSLLVYSIYLKYPGFIIPVFKKKQFEDLSINGNVKIE